MTPTITTEKLLEHVKDMKGEIARTEFVFWFPPQNKKDLKQCKEGNPTEAANHFYHFARVCGFVADWAYFRYNGTAVKVLLEKTNE